MQIRSLPILIICFTRLLYYRVSNEFADDVSMTLKIS